MKKSKALNLQRWRRTNRVRKKIRGSADRPRLNVYRSNKHIYCQLIDDEAGKTIVSASTRDKEVSSEIRFGGNVDAAKQIGLAIAEKAKSSGIKQIRLIVADTTIMVGSLKLPALRVKVVWNFNKTQF